MTGSILIVDDDPVQRRLIEAALGKFGHETISADGGETALAVLEGPRGGEIGALVLDLVMPGMNGIMLLEKMRERRIAIPAVVQTAQGGIDTAVLAMRHGAFDFVVKPASPERLNAALLNALKVEEVGGQARRASQKRPGDSGFEDIVTRSVAMEKVITLGRKAAATNIPIMIEGESGVGKELVARAIQGTGERRSKPFVTVNCGAIPENLVESILFGHEKGSFTGATEKHIGKFVEAHGGTLFLDEIGDLPPDVQVKLLRAVQTGEVDPVGSRASAKVDIRLISATHHDLQKLVDEGKFREDLFYRLNVFPIFLPPLRERREDIPLLARHFARAFADSTPRGRVPDMTDAALSLLQAYDWPGNIRQLENAMFRASVLCDGDVLGVEEFPQIKAQVHGVSERLAGRGAAAAPSRRAEAEARDDAAAKFALRPLNDAGEIRSLADVEMEMIRLAIEHYKGQMSEVARRLGIGRSTLYRKLKEYGLDADIEAP